MTFKSLEDEKLKADQYYAQERTERDLINALKATREEMGGITLVNIANVIKMVYEKAEIEVLVKFLK